MAALTPQVVTRAGITPAFVAVAASGGDTFPAGPQTYCHVKNAGGSPCVVTATPPAAAGPLGLNLSAYTQTVPATTGDREFGSFPAYPFADANGNVNLTYSFVTSVTIAVKTYAG